MILFTQFQKDSLIFFVKSYSELCFYANRDVKADFRFQKAAFTLNLRSDSILLPEVLPVREFQKDPYLPQSLSFCSPAFLQKFHSIQSV